MTNDDARWRALALAFLGGVLILRLATFLDYGVTWDEQLERRNALLTIRWYASGFTQATFPEGNDQHLYGSFFNVMVWLADQASPFDYYETAHLLITLLGFLATVMSYWIAADIAGPRAGLLAALSLTLTPVFFGHSFNNPKDVPLPDRLLPEPGRGAGAFRARSTTAQGRRRPGHDALGGASLLAGTHPPHRHAGRRRALLRDREEPTVKARAESKGLIRRALQGAMVDVVSRQS